MEKQRTLFGELVEDVLPFSCQECGKTCKSQQALSSHVRTQHPARWLALKKASAHEQPGSAIGALLLGEDEIAQPEGWDGLCYVDDDEEVASASSDWQIAAAQGQKLTKDGRPKLTRGRPKRQTVTAAVKLKAIEAHLATKEMGHPVVDDFNRACGTPFSYNSVYGWAKKRAELEKMAAKETHSKLSKQKKGWFRSNELVKKFSHRYQKTLRKTRRKARNFDNQGCFGHCVPGA